MKSLLLFGLVCSSPCSISSKALTDFNQQVVGLLQKLNYQVKSPLTNQRRPDPLDTGISQEDLAARYGQQRILSLSLGPKGRELWLTHYHRGVTGVFRQKKILCDSSDKFFCPSLAAALEEGLLPRQGREVDVLAALRNQARSLSRCVVEEDRVPLAERILGRVDMHLVVKNDGQVALEGLAPAIVARSRFGACLKNAMEQLNLGPFAGPAINLRVPIDL